MVTSEKLDLMMAISAGLKVKWSQILFTTLLSMVNNPKRQSQGYDLQIRFLLDKLVKADLGEPVKLHPRKILTGKSVTTYIKNNLKVTPAGESSKLNEDTASNTDGGESQVAQLVKKAKANLTPVLPLNKVLTVHTKLRIVGIPYPEAKTSGRSIKFHCTKKPATSRSSPRLFYSLNWVTIGRATHKEPTTKIIENNGWNRQNSREETFG
ncbi:hypothetical protein F511_21795 [Dorcoceras hygrometricum]|uniref:Uncharacterized protein n=1 Tax=Dorcoceras hygrometricum TaxID=472368 RepID=A0A2Z7BK57_9LAMI|nr:hypothetical protein F511_21795 [Dorcoceras hygrometricum]